MTEPETAAPRQDWTLTAPEISWTPAELAQIGEAIRHLQGALPGVYPLVILDRIQILPAWATDVQTVPTTTGGRWNASRRG